MYISYGNRNISKSESIPWSPSPKSKCEYLVPSPKPWIQVSDTLALLPKAWDLGLELCMCAQLIGQCMCRESEPMRSLSSYNDIKQLSNFKKLKAFPLNLPCHSPLERKERKIYNFFLMVAN